MTIKNFILPELVNLAKTMIENGQSGTLEDYKFYSDACGCMGPSEGEKLCPCEQARALEMNLVEIVAQVDEGLAKKIWLRRLVAALPG